MENTQQQNECVNKGRPVYFSYARNSSRKPEWTHISDCVEKILDQFRQNNIEYRLDVRDIGAGDKISDFEREIGWNSEVVVLIFSDKYFRSLHCMYEFVQIKNAFKKHPEKHLICIKSGNVDISDDKYIIEMEHYWGDIKQEYETIEFHHLRNHSGTEEAAYANGFYRDDIRTLNSFLGNMHWYDANTEDWSELLKEITGYYSNTSKSFLQIIQERKAKLAKLKSFGCGFSILIILILSLVLLVTFLFNFNGSTVIYPAYEENCYAMDEETFTTITKYTCDDKYTTLYLRTTNLTDDTLRNVVYDTVGTKLEIGDDIKLLGIKEFPMIEISGCNNTKLPQYYPGGKGSYVDYVIKFKSIKRNTFNFVSNGNHCIFGIIHKENHDGRTIADILDNWLDGKSDRDESNNTITTEHPEYTSGIKNLFITSIECDIQSTALHFHIINQTDRDTILFNPNECRIVINGDTLNMMYVNGIKRFPYKHTLFKKSAMDFAIHFSSILDSESPHYIEKVESINSFDFIINDSTQIRGIKLHRKKLAKAEPPTVTGHSLGSAYLTRVDITQDATVLHFKQTNRFKQTPIYASAHRKAYLMADGVKYRLSKVSGIEFAPTMTLIPAGTTLEYALIFAPLPPDTEIFDFVNVEFSREKLGEQRFKAFQYILGNECVNEKEDMIATGIYGIKMK